MIVVELELDGSTCGRFRTEALEGDFDGLELDPRDPLETVTILHLFAFTPGA